AMQEQAAGGRFEVHLVLAGGVATDARVAAVLPALPRLPEVTRVAVSWSEDGVTARHRSWIPAADGSGRWEEETRFGGVHPERARRLELWRLDGFDLERLDAADPVLVYRVRAKTNAKDERIVVYAEVGSVPAIADGGFAAGSDRREFDWVLAECLRAVREAQAERDARRRYYLNRIILHFEQPITATTKGLAAVARRFEGPTRGLGLQKVTVQARVVRDGVVERRVLSFAKRGRHRLEVHDGTPSCAPMRPATEYQVRAEQCRRLGVIYPYEIVRSLEGTAGADAAMTPHPDMANGRFVELDLDAGGARLVAVERPFGENVAGIVCGLVTHTTKKHPEGMTRVFLASDPTKAMGALAEPECRRIIAAIDLAAERRVPLEWLPVSAGALISMESGTENLDWTAKVLRRIVTFTEAGGEINIVVAGVNVGAQSYWNAEATMLMHTRGVLIMTTDGSMVLTGKKALEVSGSVAAEDERGIGGYERIMGPNGQAQYSARNLGDAYRILFEHYAYTYVVPGEKGVRRQATADPVARSVLASPYRATAGESFETVGDIFSAEANPGRKKPFAIREVMQAVVDADGGVLERYADMEGAETALVWDAHVGGHAACVIGFEGRSLTRRGAVPLDGPDAWTAGTLFPTGSKKVARAIRQASGNRPVVCLANLSGFDGSPESMRRLQLELGAEIGRAVVDFDGSIVFVVVSRYHGGAYVVFSKALNDRLVAMAVEGSYASVIGGAPAAAVVFPRDVQRRAERDPRMQALRDAIEAAPPTAREGLVAELEVLRAELVLEHQGAVAREFDAVHTVQRAVAVGSLDAVVAPAELRPAIVQVLDKAAEQDGAGAAKKSRRASPVAVG
ncbi:MAG: carbamoyl-phosphate synthase subunit L, partial [Myxococcales bacterium]|nr:carbamoyl-phosphate synthase subunit L [Myxococcales bacterium]